MYQWFDIFFSLYVDPETPYHHRQSENILKSRGGGNNSRQVASPERSLLQNQGLTDSGGGGLNYSSEDRIDLSPNTETVDLSSPVSEMRFGEVGNIPPRNIFDDLWRMQDQADKLTQNQIEIIQVKMKSDSCLSLHGLETFQAF